MTKISKESPIFEDDLSSFFYSPGQSQQSGKHCLQFGINFLCIVTKQDRSHSSLLFDEHQHLSLSNGLKVHLLADSYQINSTVLVDEVQMIDHFSNERYALNGPEILDFHLGNYHYFIL